MSKFIRFALFSVSKNYFVGSYSFACDTERLFLKQTMAQKSITSFFSKAPAKPIFVKSKHLNEIVSPKKEVKVENEDSCSPLKIGNRGSKRLRIDSDSDSNSPPEKRTSVEILKSKENGEVVAKTDAVKKELNMETVDDVATEDATETFQKSPSLKANKNVKKNKADGKKSVKDSKKESKGKTKSVAKNNSASAKKKPNKKNSLSAKDEEKVCSSDGEKGEVIDVKNNLEKKDLSSSDVSDGEASDKMDVSTKENGEKSDGLSSDEKCAKQEEKKSPTEKKKTNSSPPQQTPKKSFQSFFTAVKKSDAGSADQKDGENKKKEIKSGAEYDPSCSKYHPINDACWSRGEKVPYLALARTLEEIEKISARLKIVELLSNLFRSVIVLTPCDLLPCVYLCLNRLAPAYESVELGIAETTLMKAIAQSTGRTLAQVKNDCNTMGDLGLVAEQSKSNQRTMFQPAPLTIRGVFDKLKDIAQMTGHSSVSKKVDKIQSMFVACRHSESRYLIRSLAGKLRIGLAEQSVLQAIAQACATTPPVATQDEEWPPKVLNASKGLTAEQFKALIDEQALILKTTYCSCPNYDLIIPVILNHGVPALPDHCRLTPGIPLKPMLAHPTKGVHEVLHRFENVEFTCEWKYDGERAQIHVPSIETDGKSVTNIAAASIYSRNQENNTSKYPDVLGRLVKTMKDSVHSCVLDCEAVAWDKEKKQILPFQVLSTRKKKDASSADIKVDVCLFMFDLLYFNGESLVKRPFEERRKLLREHFVEIEGEWHMATSLDCSTTETIQEFLEESVRGNCEGLMVKTLNGKDATYEIAKRSRNWLKLKKDYLDGVGDTIDAVVLGGYLGRGKRAGVYGGFLLACHDRENEEYQSLCKIGTGFSDQDLIDHSKTLKEHMIPAPKGYYRYDPSLEPDRWFDAVQVWEVKCADLSLSPIHRAAVGIVDSEKGISLRFPRFIRIREDKAADAATSAQQIAELYCNQDQVKNQAQNANKNFEEDFY